MPSSLRTELAKSWPRRLNLGREGYKWGSLAVFQPDSVALHVAVVPPAPVFNPRAAKIFTCSFLQIGLLLKARQQRLIGKLAIL